jgi:DNA-binding transcriptional regulator YhcF (GntR family)
MKKRIIDKRKKEKFMLDDNYLNGQAKLCGWQGTLVYMSLCRHANKNQEAFPSIKLMAEQHNVSRNTILKGIKKLEERNLIQTGKKRTDSGQWLNNTYTLIDKSEWNYSQVPEKDVDKVKSQVPLVNNPSPCGEPDQVPVVNTKETHSEGNTLKETHTCEQG